MYTCANISNVHKYICMQVVPAHATNFRTNQDWLIKIFYLYLYDLSKQNEIERNVAAAPFSGQKNVGQKLQKMGSQKSVWKKTLISHRA
jgi:hypothetical protein